jgi:adenosylcobinamide-GDP ribazoletransferase
MQAQTQLPDETQTRMPGRFKPVAELIGAFRFLTRLPVPFARTISPVPLLQCMRLFPLVGAVIGVVQGIALYAAFYMGVPALLSACLSVTLVVMITGALHEDGLADTADGFGGGKDREQRLLIMRDSRIGTYGTVALILAFMIRVTALEALLNQPLFVIVSMCAAAGSFSRAMMVDLLWASRPARSDGLSVYAGRPSRGTTLFAIFSGGHIGAGGCDIGNGGNPHDGDANDRRADGGCVRGCSGVQRNRNPVRVRRHQLIAQGNINPVCKIGCCRNGLVVETS